MFNLLVFFFADFNIKRIRAFGDGSKKQNNEIELTFHLSPSCLVTLGPFTLLICVDFLFTISHPYKWRSGGKVYVVAVFKLYLRVSWNGGRTMKGLQPNFYSWRSTSVLEQENWPWRPFTHRLYVFSNWVEKSVLISIYHCTVKFMTNRFTIFPHDADCDYETWYFHFQKNNASVGADDGT